MLAFFLFCYTSGIGKPLLASGPNGGKSMRKLGRIVLNMSPSQSNPRNSEGAFLELADGRLLFAYSRFIGESHADAAPSCIAMKQSRDRGETWSDEIIIATPEEHGVANIMSVSLLHMLNGDIGLFYFIRRARNDGRLHMRRSADQGKTWEGAQCCMPGLGYYATNNDRVVRLASGRLIIPAAFHKMLSENTEYRSEFKSTNDSKGLAHYFLSDDDGATWREAKNFCALDSPHSATGLQEPGVIELNNGVLWSWARTDMGCQYEMFSFDGGESWTHASPSVFTSPRSPLSMKRIPGYGHLLAVWNPIPNYLTRVIAPKTGGRTPLVGAISKDEGKTWGNYFAIETEEDRGGYCYTAICFADDAVLLAYCAGTPEDGSLLSRLKIRKILLEDILSQPH
jgi:hypothetical protein